VGVTLYELLTGTLPIKGANNYEIMMGHINQEPVAPHQLSPQVPTAISEAVMRALAKDPLQRFASADEFLHALPLTPANTDQGNTYAAPLPAAPAPMPASAAHETPVSSPARTQMASAPKQSKSGSSSGFQNLSLEEISRRLAEYIGPVAKIVVKKLAAQSDDLDFIFHEAAKQIPSDADRAAFLKARRQ
jgi:serine/threonine-protein kinase